MNELTDTTKHHNLLASEYLNILRSFMAQIDIPLGTASP